jgi:hypothetical protein
MIQFTATLKKMGQQGEKTGWTYFDIPAKTAGKIQPGTKKIFRVKGMLDVLVIAQVAILPMGGGDYMMPVNGHMRKALKKQHGAVIKVILESDTSDIIPPFDLLECLNDAPEAKAQYQALTKGHQNYFTRWISEAKTDNTRAKRIAQTISGLEKGMDFGEILRAAKEERKILGR